MTRDVVEAGGFRLGVTVREPACGAAPGSVVLYLHGGGLLFGERDDLPETWAGMLARAGHRLVALDYPLAPETPVGRILDVCEEAVRALALDSALALLERGYVLFGRSAGAYLALKLASRLVRARDVPAPRGVMDFYGYPSLEDARLVAPSRHYTKLAPVDEATALAHVGGAPTRGALSERFLLYVWARQQGRWMELIGAGTPEVRAACSLGEGELAALPPVFACAGTADQDVPFGASRRLRQVASSVTWVPVYDAGHDFDRDPGSPQARDVYERAVAWLGALDAGEPVRRP